MALLGVLGRQFADQQKESGNVPSLKGELLKRLVFGGSWSAGAAVVFGLIELMRSDPERTFPLLLAWGPKAIGGLILIYVIYDLAKTLLGAVVRLVPAVESMAKALQQSADKDDRQVQEMQTLTAYTAQQSERTNQTIAKLGETLDAMNEKLDRLASTQRAT